MTHPNARILNARNTARGIKARSLILGFLEGRREEATTKEIAEGASLKVYQVYFHLLRLTEAGNVMRLSRRPARWEISDIGQKRISIFLPV